MTTLDITGVRPKVLEILRARPNLSYSRIADEVGVTRERVRQIAHKNGYPPRQGNLTPKICPLCGDIYYSRRLYCSDICAHKARRKIIVVICHHCGKSMERAPATLRRNGNGRYFCSRLCFYARWNKENRSIKA
jgi:hypothetical protein